MYCDLISEWDFQIFIISYKRSGKVSSDKVFNNAFIVVPESQLKDYEKYEYSNGCKLLAIPDECDGNIVRKRNWILNNFSGNVIIVDDDYKYFGMNEGLKKLKITADEVDMLIHNGCMCCREIGTVMWGVNMSDDPMWYREYSPFSTQCCVLGPFQAFCDLPRDIRYDERLYLKEDYDMSLQVLQRYHKVFRFIKYHYVVNHLDLEGGVVSYRTLEKEKEHNLRLQKKWGKETVKFDMSVSVNPKIKMPFKGM